MAKIGLTLTGGGARGAYQAGVLRAIQHICQFQKCPFQIISGISAGSINGMTLAAGADNFDAATKLLWDTWTSLSVDDVFKTDTLTLLKTGTSWLRDLSLGAWFGKKGVTHLLDTSPLYAFLNKNINMGNIDVHVRSGLLSGVALSATDYRTGRSVTFFDGDPSIQPWTRTSGFGRRAQLTTAHIMASTAIPIFFPPIRIDDADYGDGGIGLKAPVSPSIHLGADKILIIGLDHKAPQEALGKIATQAPVSLGDIAGTLLNSLFLNSLDSDLSRLNQTNRTLSFLTPEQIDATQDHLRKVPTLLIEPSIDLGEIDVDQYKQFPFTVRHLLNGLGVTSTKGWDLLSYLAFDSVYSSELLKRGYNDALAQREHIIEFFKPSVNAATV